ncbi:MAG: phosphate signaling complex protein PhoU [Oscillospiraceae bacterium]
MREKFDMQLEELNRKLIKMGALCESAIAAAVKSLRSADKNLIESVRDSEREIDHMEREIEGLCMRIIIRQQPVAGDLRTVSSALKMITDMERIGDQAADIADIAPYCRLEEYPQLKEDISDMASVVVKMVTDSVDAFVKRDISAAQNVISSDDAADGLFIKIKGDIINMITEKSGDGEAAVDIVMTAKYLERIGDHASNIAEWVEYSLTGTH